MATRTLTFSSVESLTGGSAVDTFEINAALAGSIMGGGGADILNLNTSGSVTGMVDGGAEGATLNYSGRNERGGGDADCNGRHCRFYRYGD